MAEEDYKLVREGIDDTEAYDYNINVRTFDNSDSGEFTVDLFLNEIDMSETHTNYDFMVDLYGEASEKNREVFIERLESEGVLSVARNEAATAIFDDIYSAGEVDLPFYMNARMVICIDTYEYYCRLMRNEGDFSI